MKLGVQNPLAAHYVVRVEKNGRVAVGGVGFVVKREVALAQDIVRPPGVTAPHCVKHKQRMFDCGGLSLKECLVLAARMQGVLDAAVGAGVEVATGARLPVVAGVHLPEKGLAEHHRHVGVDDDIVDAGNLRQVRGRERS